MEHDMGSCMLDFTDFQVNKLYVMKTVVKWLKCSKAGGLPSIEVSAPSCWVGLVNTDNMTEF